MWLREKRDELVRRWLRGVRERLGEHLPHKDLIDHLPSVLDELEAALRTPAGPGAGGAQPGVAATAAGHGAQRASLGIDVSDVVREYGVLRDIVLDLLEESGLLPTIGEVRVLTAAITSSVAESVREYASQRDALFRAAANRFREIADHAPAAIFVKDAQGRYEFVNRAYANLVGKEPSAILGRTDTEVLPAKIAAYFSPIQARVAAGETVELEGRFRTALGDRTYRMIQFPLQNDPGALAVIGVDVTEREATERRMQEAAAFERQLIGIVSHDLRTPIGTLQLSARSLLARDDLPDGAARTVARMVAVAERSGRMIRDLLDLTRARLGSGIPIKADQVVDVAEALEQVLEGLRDTYPTRDIRSDVEGPTTGRWDADRVAQIFENLLRNALDHGDSRAPVSVSLRGDDTSLRIQVHNSGEPIPPDILPRMFESGVRGAKTPGTGGGLGLGLYVVERVATAHGGAVTVSSTREQGTTFTVVLPRESRWAE